MKWRKILKRVKKYKSLPHSEKFYKEEVIPYIMCELFGTFQAFIGEGDPKDFIELLDENQFIILRNLAIEVQSEACRNFIKKEAESAK